MKGGSSLVLLVKEGNMSGSMNVGGKLKVNKSEIKGLQYM